MSYIVYKKIGNQEYAYDRRKFSEKMILDFGDAFIIRQILDGSKFSELIKTIFQGDADTMLALTSYRLCSNSARCMQNIV